MNNFSAFKLFYNEIIYKDNSSINYYNVKRNITEIRNIVLVIRNVPKNNINLYNLKLKRAKKRIRYHLGKIMEYNNDIYKYFDLLYKTKCQTEIDYDNMPNILANSFYEDYLVLEDGSYKLNNVVPKYSSLEKKQIRDEAKGMDSFNYLVKLLDNSSYRYLYDSFLKKATYLLSIKPISNESYEEYVIRTDKLIKECSHLFKRLERKARYSDDYDVIKEQMNIVYKMKFNNWDTDIKTILSKHFIKVYEDKQKEFGLKEIFNNSNDITYERYSELSEMLDLEKQNLMDNFANNHFIKRNSNDNSYTIRFKEDLINNYFDERYKNNLNDKSKVSEYVNRALELYELGADLTDQIFERIIFDSSHSSGLKRNNEVNSALLTKIYDLYNPVYLVGIYSKAKDEFEEMLDRQDEGFKDKYQKELNTRKMEYNYHGPIPSKETIKTNVIKKRKEFIIEHAITDLISIDVFGNYDTRNYDLNIMAEALKIGELVNLYLDIKDKINSYDFTSVNYLDKLVSKEEEVEKKLLLKAAQEFIVKLIYNNLNLNLVKEEEINNKYRDICYGYLNEEILFINEDKEINNDKVYNEFLEARNGFKEVSKWAYFIKN